MPRPLIEYIYAQHLPWQAGLPGDGRRDISAKILSQDSENGESSIIARYSPGWKAAEPHALSAEEEMYVLDGDITINGRLYRRDTYACFPAGYVRETSRSEKGCVALTFFDGIPNYTTTPADPDATFVDYLDIYDMPWDGKRPGVVSDGLPSTTKILRWDRERDQKATFVFFLPPHSHPENWACPTLTHHCVEESFKLAGDITGPHGRQGIGSYFWRPPNVPHGPFGSRDGGMSIIRFRHGKHENIWADKPVPYSYDVPYRPTVPEFLRSFAKDYEGTARY